MSLPVEQAEQAMEVNAVDYVEKCISLAGMPKVMAYILREEMTDYTSESPPATAQQIADRVGCHINSVFKAHKDARFLSAKDKIQDIWFNSQAGSVYKAVLDTARAGKVGAQRLALDVMGKHVTRVETKNVNINADIMGVQDGSMDNATAMVDKFLIMLGNRAWSLDMIADRWRILKSQQAF